MTFKWCEDAMVFHVFIFIFCLGPTLRKDTQVAATSDTVTVIFSNMPYSKFLLHNNEAHWQQNSEKHPTVEDFTDIDQDAS